MIWRLTASWNNSLSFPFPACRTPPPPSAAGAANGPEHFIAPGFRDEQAVAFTAHNAFNVDDGRCVRVAPSPRMEGTVAPLFLFPQKDFGSYYNHRRSRAFYSTKQWTISGNTLGEASRQGEDRAVYAHGMSSTR